jgi:hypothetical protein
MPEDNKPEQEKPKRELPAAMKAAQFKPGHSGNPAGRPVGSKPSGAKLLSRFSQIIGRSMAHGSWFPKDLEYLKDQQLTVNELVAIMQMYCLATNTAYKNAALLKTVYERFEGKVPLRILHKPEEIDDYETLTDEELEAWITERNQRLAEQVVNRLETNVKPNPNDNQSGLEGTGDAPASEGSTPPQE